MDLTAIAQELACYFLDYVITQDHAQQPLDEAALALELREVLADIMPLELGADRELRRVS